jgi:hypothetical protein
MPISLVERAMSVSLRKITLPVLLVLVASIASCGAANTATPGGSVPAPATLPNSPDPTRADVRAFVDKAVAFAKARGKPAALQAFTAISGEFHQGQLYVFAYDFSGTVLAHGGDATLVGKNLIDMRDPTGVMVIKELVRLASEGSGWLAYTWPNPAHANAEEPKYGYVVKVDDGWFVGSGTYGPAAIQP